MPIEFFCTECHKLLRTPDDTAGKKAKCPQCDTILDVPGKQPSVGGSPFVPPPAEPSDSTNPFQSPSESGPLAAPGPSPFSEQAVLAKVKPPAIALIVLGSLGAVMGLLGLVLNVVQLVILNNNNMGGPAPPPPVPEWAMIGVIIAISAVGILVQVLVIVGAVKMLKLESYGLAMAASIAVMIPCGNICCFLGIPFGIWSIVVLNDYNVKAAFRN